MMKIFLKKKNWKNKKKQFILVDHNERKQTIDDIEEREIIEIVDHHRIGDGLLPQDHAEGDHHREPQEASLLRREER